MFFLRIIVYIGDKPIFDNLAIYYYAIIISVEDEDAQLC